MELFELSLSPYFNTVIRACEAAYYREDDEVISQELEEALQNMTQFCQVLVGSFNEALSIRPKSELSLQLPNRFEKEMRIIMQSISTIKSFLHDKKIAILPPACQQGSAAIERMFAIFEEMKAEEESFPIFSKSPYIQELVRIATGVAKGQYKSDTLNEKLQWMRDRYNEFKADFAEMQNIPKENEDVEKLLPVAESALNKMGVALERMSRFTKTYDKNLLKEGCAELLQSSEVLIAVQDRLMKVSTAQPAACPKCGAMNPGGARRCRECDAVMPAVAGLSTQTIEVKENTDNDNRPSFTYLARLEGAIESRKQGLLSIEEFTKEASSFANRARQGCNNFKNIERPGNLPEVVKETTDRGYNLMQEGVTAVASGAAKIEAYCQNQELELLDSGWEEINRGAAQMLEGQETIAQGLASAQQ